MPDLDRLSALAEAATAGPWVFATDKGPPDYVQLYSASEEIDEYAADVLSASDGADLLISEPDAEFIVAARTAIPALVAVARAAEDVSNAYPDISADGASAQAWERFHRAAQAQWLALAALRDSAEEGT